MFVRLLSVADMLIKDKKQWFGPEINTNFSKDNFRLTAKELIK